MEGRVRWKADLGSQVDRVVHRRRNLLTDEKTSVGGIRGVTGAYGIKRA